MGVRMFTENYNPELIMELCSLDELNRFLERGLVALEKKKIADRYEEENNYDLAFQYYREASTFGDVDSLYKIGTYYENGYSVDKNIFRAYVYYERAAEQGNIESLQRLATEFFNGSDYCPQNTEIAKRYWIRLFINNPTSENENILNTRFLGWKNEPNTEFDSFRFKRKPLLEKFAKKGIAAAAYWLGKHLYSTQISEDLQSILGYEHDSNMARRWLLTAALDDYPPAENELRNQFNIDLESVSTGKEMFLLGNNYTDDSTECGKDLRFFWLKKALNWKTIWDPLILQRRITLTP